MLIGASRSGLRSSINNLRRNCPRDAVYLTRRREFSPKIVKLEHSRPNGKKRKRKIKKEKKKLKESIGNLFIRLTAMIDSNHPSFVRRSGKSSWTGAHGTMWKVDVVE